MRDLSPKQRRALLGAASDARRQALALLVRIETTEAFADRALNSALARGSFGEADRALITELTYGTLRHQAIVDERLQALLTKPLRTLPVPVRAALRLGAYQLLMTRVPDYSAVDETVKLVGRKYGALKGLVNGVLRALIRDQADGRDSTRAGKNGAPAISAEQAMRAHPEWLQKHVSAVFGEAEATEWMVENLRAPNICVRVNTCRTTPQALTALLIKQGIQAAPSRFCGDSLVLPPSGRVTELPGFQEGLMAVQDTAATLVTKLLQLGHKTTVLDLCAAPGGKAMHAASLMNNEGHVVACDSHPGRLQMVQRNAQRLGHPNIMPLHADITTKDGAFLLKQALKDLPPVSHVMLDAPCSALGTLKRHPELRRKDGSHIPKLVQLQKRLLDAAVEFVAPGACLVYAVCTFTHEEGPGQIEAFLRRHQDFSLQPLPDGLDEVSDGRYLRTFPHRHGIDGFFAARLVRSAMKLPQPSTLL